MNPADLIGMKYRLGACPAKHGVGDCFSVAASVVNYFGFDAPEPKREWYRRLRRGDSSVFKEELERWGIRTDLPRLGAVALCEASNGYGLAVWYSEGWLNFAGSEVVWSPIGGLPVVECFYPRKPSFVMQSV